jgi:hypothetical protein
MYLHILKELGPVAAYLQILNKIKSFGMCRYEGVSYLQKLKELKSGALYLHIPKGLGRGRPRESRIGVAGSTDSYLGVTLSQEYHLVKRKLMTKSVTLTARTLERPYEWGKKGRGGFDLPAAGRNPPLPHDGKGRIEQIV